MRRSTSRRARCPRRPTPVAAFGSEDRRAVRDHRLVRPAGEELRIAIADLEDRSRATRDGRGARPQERRRRPSYHQLLGDALGDAWTKARRRRRRRARASGSARPLATDIYPVFMMGRGLGYFTGALSAMAGDGKGPISRRPSTISSARCSSIRSCYEAQRLLGELYLARGAAGDPKAGRAGGRQVQLRDRSRARRHRLAARGGACATARAGKQELALELFSKLVTRAAVGSRRALPARRGAVAARRRAAAPSTSSSRSPRTQPDHLAGAPRARADPRVAQRHAASSSPSSRRSRSARPDDLEVKGDLATGVRRARQVGPRRSRRSSRSPQARPNDLALLVRIGDAHRKPGDLDGALAWYARAAQARAGLEPARLRDRRRRCSTPASSPRRSARTRSLQKFTRRTCRRPSRRSARSRSLQNRADDAAWYLRRAVREAPRSLPTRRARDRRRARAQGRRAPRSRSSSPRSPAWPDDAQLHYLAGVAHAMLDDDDRRRARELATALAAAPELPPARAALGALDAGGSAALDCTRPSSCGRGATARRSQAALDRYALHRDDDGDGARRVPGRSSSRCSARSARGRDAPAEAAGACARVPSAESRRRGRPRSRRSRATSGSASSSRRVPVHRAPRRGRADRGPAAERAHRGRRREEELPASRSPTSASCAPSGRAASAPSCARSAAATSCSRPRSRIRRATR